MPTVSVRPEFPNILIVSGADVYTPGTMIGLTKQALDGATDQPVHGGTHEFWVLHPVFGFPGASFFTGQTDNASPRRRRGIIQMSMLPAVLDEPSIGTYLSTLLQEVGHNWLCPSDIKIKINGTPTRMANRNEMTQAINDDTPFANPPLLARDESHWSAYWRADGSPLDGVCFQHVGNEDGHEIWRTTTTCGQVISLDPSVPSVNMRGYNDLDLHIMGVKPADEAYRGQAGIVWMQPRITEFAESHTGIVVAFSPTDQLMFGYWQHDSMLSLRNTAGQNLAGDLIWPKYHPLQHPMNGLMFRVIRRRNQYFFQARISNPAGGCLGFLGPSTLPHVWENVDNPQPFSFNANYQNWKTVGMVQRDKPPQAVGTFVNKWRSPHLCDAAFFRFELKAGTDTWGMSTNAVPPLMTAGDYSVLMKGKLHRQESDGAIFRVKSKRLHVVAPYGRVTDSGVELMPDERFRHRTGEDNSLKVLTKAPDGDFAFATHAKLHRTIVTPWAGGYVNGKEVFGIASRASAADVVLSQNSLSRQTLPPENTFRMAFIAVAPDAASIPLEALERLDTLRRYWEVAFASATEERLFANTAL